MSISLKPAIFIDAELTEAPCVPIPKLKDIARGLLTNRPHTNAFIARNYSQDNGYLIAFAEPYERPCFIVSVVATADGIHPNIETVFQSR